MSPLRLRCITNLFVSSKRERGGGGRERERGGDSPGDKSDECSWVLGASLARGCFVLRASTGCYKGQGAYSCGLWMGLCFGQIKLASRRGGYARARKTKETRPTPTQKENNASSLCWRPVWRETLFKVPAQWILFKKSEKANFTIVTNIFLFCKTRLD